jgi:8-oxo-dGTP pyrophosphatase MutT (NUDIX family)
MPEGGAPFDEEPLAGIKRELAEEAGLKAAHWQEALRLQLSNSVTDERGIVWLCWGLSPTAIAPDPTEVIITARTPFLTLLDAIGRGQVQDALTVATALRAYHMARESLLPGWLAHVMLHRL